MKVFVKTGGEIRQVYNEKFDIRFLGDSNMERAGHVEPAPNGRDWRVTMPDGVVLGDFKMRSEAIKAEECEVVRRLRHGSGRQDTAIFQGHFQGEQ